MNTSPTPTAVFLSAERTRVSAAGIAGGGPGATGAVEINANPVDPKVQHVLEPGDVATLRTPGGGGHGAASERDPHAMARDRRLGYV